MKNYSKALAIFLAIVFLLTSTTILAQDESTEAGGYIILGAIVLLIWIFMYINRPQQEKEQEKAEKEELPVLPDFFVCNRWIDKNQDGRGDFNEFEGVKSKFRAHEDITFVANIRKPFGTIIYYKLLRPDGVTHQYGVAHWERKDFQAYEPSVFDLTFSARSLAKEGGVGAWRMEWYVEGHYVGKSEATIRW
jgi:hypothetical protein